MTSMASSQPGFADKRYRELQERLDEAGCFAPARLHHAIRAAVIVAALSVGFWGLLAAPGWPIRLLFILLTAFACVQAAFVAHDVGDGALTENAAVSGGLRQFLLTFACGTSSTYFHHVHRLHHLSLDRRSRPNGGGRIMGNRYEIAWLKRLLAVDGRLFMVGTITLRGLTFRMESLRFVIANPKTARADMLMLLTHYAVWFGVPAAILGPWASLINLALVTLFAGSYIGTVLVLNHEDMCRVDEVADLAPLDRVLATTRNLSASPLSSVLLGGVNNHIEHHLFPDMPVRWLPQARRVVRHFCLQRGLPYAEATLASALASAKRHFQHAGRERLVAEALS